MARTFRSLIVAVLWGLGWHAISVGMTRAAEPAWLWSTAHAIPKELTTEGSGYFSIIEGKNGRVYVGTAKYGFNAFLVEPP